MDMPSPVFNFADAPDPVEVQDPDAGDAASDELEKMDNGSAECEVRP